MKKYLSLYALLIAALFYSCNDFQKVPNTDEGDGELFAYCFFSDGQYCLEGPYSSCSRGGKLTNSCDQPERIVQMSYCLFDADTICMIGGGDISKCPGASRSEAFCPWEIPEDTSEYDSATRFYCQFTDDEGNETCLPSPYPDGSCPSGEGIEAVNECDFYDSTVVVARDLCNGVYYDKQSEFCGTDQLIHKKCGGREYDVSESKALFCSQGTVLGHCGPQLYNDDLSFCRNEDGEKILFDKCNGEEYETETEFCVQAEHNGIARDTVVLKNSTWELKCAAENYKPTEKFCPENVETAIPLCGGRTFDLEKEFCYNDSEVRALCSGESYTPEQACVEGIGVVTKCPGGQYLMTGECSDDDLPKCGGISYRPYNPAVYNPDTPGQRCNMEGESPVLETLCGLDFTDNSMWYSDVTHFCYESELQEKCGGEEYEVSAKDSTVSENGLEFSIVKQETCEDGAVVSVCEGDYIIPSSSSVFDPDIHFCINVLSAETFVFEGATRGPGTYFVPLCNGHPYDVTRQFCYNEESINNYCGDNMTEYDPALSRCGNEANGESPTGIYLRDPVPVGDHDYQAVLIGGYYYFTENLKTQTESSTCFNGDCETYADYGQYYTLEEVENNELCPEGWQLMDFYSFRLNDAERLAAGSWGTDGLGNDYYGFNAISSGYCNNPPDLCSDYMAIWWVREIDDDFGVDRIYTTGIEYVSGIGLGFMHYASGRNDWMLPIRCAKPVAE
ncbi:MAG: hypothetical protein LBR60_09160 [Fibrobacter sp.]|jgi:uncharacterized protein (TIGR02145 family)|nr:hypothetical protein [Fibrobacter sp.]